MVICHLKARPCVSFLFSPLWVKKVRFVTMARIGYSGVPVTRAGAGRELVTGRSVRSCCPIPKDLGTPARDRQDAGATSFVARTGRESPGVIEGSAAENVGVAKFPSGGQDFLLDLEHGLKHSGELGNVQ